MSGAKTKIKIAFDEKCSWQKDDCINRSKEYDCPNPSTLQLDVVEGLPEQHSSSVRCCADERCKARALDITKHIVAAWLDCPAEKIEVEVIEGG